MRQLAGDELVEQHAQRVDVGRHGHRFAVDLLRRGVGRRQGAHVAARQVRLTLRLEKLRQTEVEQLRLARRGDQDVRRLEVAVHDEAAVRRIDGARHGDEQTQAGGERQPAAPAHAR
jgi:hypothetical protein